MEDKKVFRTRQGVAELGSGGILGCRAPQLQVVRVAIPAILLLLLALGLSGCGKKKRLPPIPPPAPQAGVTRAAARIRVLLREGFLRVEVLGGQRADRLLVEAADQNLSLFKLDNKGKKDLLERGTGFRIESAQGQLLSVGGERYRGVVDLFMNPLGVPVVVNELDVEEYLRGVVPRELGPKAYPVVSALKAQSVAARTYSLASKGNYASRGFDVFNDVRSQVYSGAKSEDPLSDRAVSETAGVVATYEGGLIHSFYCSTCGGKTEAYRSIFGGKDLAYLPGGVECPDKSSPYHSWEEWVDVRRIQSELDRYAKVGRLKKLKPLVRSSAGRIIEMEFEGDKGKAVLKGNDLRFALGLRSNYIQKLSQVTDSEGFIDRFFVKGKGWGHGVGLCQIGAVELGRRGWGYEEILKHYYRGIHLQRWY